MQPVAETLEPQEDVGPTGQPPRRARWWMSSGWTAVAAWLVATPIAFLVPKILKLNPISPRGAMAPVLLLAIGIAIAIVVLVRGRAGEAIVGVLAGLYSAWFILLGRSMLYGTPFGYEGMEGDAKRIVAMAMRYTTTWASADAYAEGRPAIYPPLFPWLVGRLSNLTGVQPYHLVQYAQLIVMSLAVLFAFLLWRRLVPSVVAFGIAAVSLVGYDSPDKPYEVIILAVVLPWALATFANPPRGRLHWLPAGLIGGLIVLCYQGFLVFAGVGIAYLLWRGWRAAENRRGELVRLGLIALTSFVVSSWYVLPYLYSVFFLPPQRVWEDYQHGYYGVFGVPLPFLEPVPSSALLAIGFVGLVWWSRTLWWARSLGIILVGAYLYYGVGALRFLLTGNNMFAHYAARLISEIMAVAGVLVLAEVVRQLLGSRFDVARIRRSAIVFGGVVLMIVSLGYWHMWQPTLVPYVKNPRVNLNVVDLNPADAPLTQPLPDGTLPKYASKDAGKLWLPVWHIRDEVAARYGKDYIPRIVTHDERVFAYLPWYAYDPAFFYNPAEMDPHRLIADSKAGKIDVFVLKAGTRDDGRWVYRRASFEPSWFDAASFDVVYLENDYVLVIRKR